MPEKHHIMRSEGNSVYRSATSALSDLCENALYRFFEEDTTSGLDDVRQWLDENKRNQKLLRKAANYINNRNSTPLHWLVRTRPPPDLVEILLHFAPGSAKIQDEDGDFPLHRACRDEASAKVVQMLIEQFPGAVEVADMNGGLPLNLSLMYKASTDVVQLLLNTYQNAIMIPDNNGYLPLHYACINEDSFDTVQILLSAYPTAAEKQDNEGGLPLHKACEYFAIYDVVKILLDVYPKSTLVRDHSGCLPIHYACGDVQFSLEVIDLLLSAFPESTGVKSSAGMLPIDYLRQSSKHYSYEDHKFDLHDAVFNGYSIHLVKLLLQAFPERSLIQDKDGMVPLHYACMKNAAEISISVVSFLIDAIPDACTIVNNNGDTPLHLLKGAASHRDEYGMLLLHRAAATSKELSSRFLRILADIYPDSITFPDNYRMLPFHHACLNAHHSIELLLHFIQLYPECIQVAH
jgi:ankyrin repeat protein